MESMQERSPHSRATGHHCRIYLSDAGNSGSVQAKSTTYNVKDPASAAAGSFAARTGSEEDSSLQGLLTCHMNLRVRSGKCGMPSAII